MKKLLLIIFTCSGIIAANAQNTVNITPQEYNTLKISKQLDFSKKYVFTNINTKQKVKPTLKSMSGTRSASSICSCLIALDSSFSVVPFAGSTPPDYRNDDMSSDTIHLPFSFNFYGTNYNSLFINNNGNISFIAPYYTFTSDSFPSAAYNMIAPFWGDVDTRDSLSGLVYYKITPTSMIVKWENVGYFSMHSDLQNTFQLIITDGTDPILPSGTNVSFCYGDMQWTTGDASSGISGFGGVPSTVGVNQGDGTDYFQVGRFDGAGNGFDGPYGSNDSIDWLDNQGMYFDVATLGNIPPVIINNNICDTIDVYTGDTTHAVFTYIDSVEFRIGVSTPEAGQVISSSFVSSLPSHFSYSLTRNTPTYKEYNCKFITKGTAAGLYTINITATDNGTPEKQTNRTIVIRSKYDNALGIAENNTSALISIYPNPAEESITVKHNFNTSFNPVLSIVDVVGQNVMSVQLNNQEQNIDISHLSKGIYFATITGKEGKTKTIKIVRK